MTDTTRIEKMEKWLCRMTYNTDGIHESAMWQDWRECKAEIDALKSDVEWLRTAWEIEHTERIRLEERLKQAQSELKNAIEVYKGE
jgi:hypothetical protein